MRKNKIEILSPGQSCLKTKKIIKKIQKLISEANLDAEIIVVSDLPKILEYETWILPTVVVNGKIVARGYKPADEVILNQLTI